MTEMTEMTVNIEGYLKYKNAMEILETRREANRICSKKYYDKTMKLDDNATLKQLQKQKDILNKRDAYQKNYYKKNKDAICERQRQYRLKKKLSV